MSRFSLLLAAAVTVGIAGEQDSTDIHIKNLESSHYPTRMKAHKMLEGMINADVAKKLKAATLSGDLEKTRRAEELLEIFYGQEIARILEECGGKFPWADSKANEKTTVQKYVSQSQGTVCDPDFSKYRNATRLVLLDALRRGGDVHALVEQMKKDELLWIENYNKTARKPIPRTWK